MADMVQIKIAGKTHKRGKFSTEMVRELIDLAERGYTPSLHGDKGWQYVVSAGKTCFLGRPYKWNEDARLIEESPPDWVMDTIKVIDQDQRAKRDENDIIHLGFRPRP